MAKGRNPKAPWLEPSLTNEQEIMLTAMHQKNPVGRRISENGAHYSMLLWLIQQRRLIVEAQGTDVSGRYIQFALPPATMGSGERE